MDDLYRGELEFLDLSNLDANAKDEITALLKPDPSDLETLKLPWDKGGEEIIVYQENIEEDQLHDQEVPKVWQQYEVEENLMKYDHAPSASSVLVAVSTSSMTPYGQATLVQPLYSEWATGTMYNIPADPSVQPYMQPMYPTGPQGVYAAPVVSTTNADTHQQQDISVIRDGLNSININRRPSSHHHRTSSGRAGSGGALGTNTLNNTNKSYSHHRNAINVTHATTTEMHPGYIADPNQYQIPAVPQANFVYCVQTELPPTLAAQPHHHQHPGAMQPIYYPQVYQQVNAPMQTVPPTQHQSTHRMDYSPVYHHQTPSTNHKYNNNSNNSINSNNSNRQSQNILISPHSNEEQNQQLQQPQVHLNVATTVKSTNINNNNINKPRNFYSYTAATVNSTNYYNSNIATSTTTMTTPVTVTTVEETIPAVHHHQQHQLQQLIIDDDLNNSSSSSSSQTNIVTTVIVNNSNIESSSLKSLNEKRTEEPVTTATVIDENGDNSISNINNNVNLPNMPSILPNDNNDILEQQVVSNKASEEDKQIIEKDNSIECSINEETKPNMETRLNGSINECTASNKEIDCNIMQSKTPPVTVPVSMPSKPSSVTSNVETFNEEINKGKEVRFNEEINKVKEVQNEKLIQETQKEPPKPVLKSWASIVRETPSEASQNNIASNTIGNKPIVAVVPNNSATVVNGSEIETPQVIPTKTFQNTKINEDSRHHHHHHHHHDHQRHHHHHYHHRGNRNDNTSSYQQHKKLNNDITHENQYQIHSDPNNYRMGEFLINYKIDRQTVSLLPRGLTNRSNYCYINSILQALLACPPFFNLLNSMPHYKSRHSQSPLLDNMIRFVREFSPLSESARLARRDRSQKKSADIIDIHHGIPFEPSYIYAILKNTSFSEEGRQEDAEEFLSCLLNGISDEMLELMKLASSNDQKIQLHNDVNTNYTQGDDEWKVMGPKNKGSVTRSTDFGRTPLSDIFRGSLRSRVLRAQEEATDYVQPFFTLQLDVEKAESVKTALEILVGKDAVEGMTCSVTNQKIEAWKQLTLEELPIILVLHLKWFDYKPDGCSKIVKTVEFPVDLKIDNKLLSSNTRSKYNTKQKQYKLFAVTYHDGKEATKGHYVTDAFHVGFGGWVRYDDSSLKGVSEDMVLRPQPPRVPYLLYYRRCDTIGINQSNNNSNRNR